MNFILMISLLRENPYLDWKESHNFSISKYFNTTELRLFFIKISYEFNHDDKSHLNLKKF